METKKLVLTAILILIGLSVYSQSKNIDIVKEYYPHIYISIKNEAEKDKLKNKAALTSQMEQQSKAFLQIAESKILIDPDAMTDALLLESLNGEREYNRSVIDDLDIKNPYPLLRCNWYGVKTHYDKIKNSKANIDSAKNTSKDINKYKDEIYGNEIRFSKKSKATGNTSGPAKSREFYKGGVSLDVGLSSITGLSDWDRNANPGKIIEVSASLREPCSKSFFLMTQFSTAFIHHSITDYNINKNGNLNQFNLNTYLYFGFFHNLSASTTLLFGLGGFLGVNLSTNEAAYIRNDENTHPNSNDLGEFNYGLSGSLAIQVNKYEFALRPNWGLADISRGGLDLNSRTISLSVGYLF